MNFIFALFFCLIATSFSYSQNSNKNILYVDSLGKKTDSNLDFIVNNGSDTIGLEELFNLDLTNQLDISPYKIDYFENTNLSDIAKNRETIERSSLCVSCRKENIKIMDSIDINEDGIKELFLFREWHCRASPSPLGVINPFGIGDQQQSYSQYEVWDTKTKTQLAEIKNRVKIGVTITVNDGRSHGYSFDVKIDKQGGVFFSNQKGTVTGYKMGKHQYCKDLRTYIKKE